MKAIIKSHFGGEDSALANTLFNLFDRDGSKYVHSLFFSFSLFSFLFFLLPSPSPLFLSPYSREIDFKEFAIAYGFLVRLLIITLPDFLTCTFLCRQIGPWMMLSKLVLEHWILMGMDSSPLEVCLLLGNYGQWLIEITRNACSCVDECKVKEVC